VLYRSLLLVEKLWDGGERGAARLVAAGRAEVAKEKSVRLDYFEIVDPESLDPVEHAADALVAVAAFVGPTRLIDNILL